MCAIGADSQYRDEDRWPPSGGRCARSDAARDASPAAPRNTLRRSAARRHVQQLPRARDPHRQPGRRAGCPRQLRGRIQAVPAVAGHLHAGHKVREERAHKGADQAQGHGVPGARGEAQEPHRKEGGRGEQIQREGKEGRRRRGRRFGRGRRQEGGRGQQEAQGRPGRRHPDRQAQRAVVRRRRPRGRQGRAQGGRDPADQVPEPVHGQAVAVEGHPAVRPAGHRKDLPGQGRRDRGGLYLPQRFLLGPGQQVDGRVRAAGQAALLHGPRAPPRHHLRRRDRLPLRRARRGRIRGLAPHKDRVPRADAGRRQRHPRHPRPGGDQHPLGAGSGAPEAVRAEDLHPAAGQGGQGADAEDTHRGHARGNGRGGLRQAGGHDRGHVGLRHHRRRPRRPLRARAQGAVRHALQARRAGLPQDGRGHAARDAVLAGGPRGVRDDVDADPAGRGAGGADGHVQGFHLGAEQHEKVGGEGGRGEAAQVDGGLWPGGLKGWLRARGVLRYPSRSIGSVPQLVNLYDTTLDQSTSNHLTPRTMGAPARP